MLYFYLWPHPGSVNIINQEIKPTFVSAAREESKDLKKCVCICGFAMRIFVDCGQEKSILRWVRLGELRLAVFEFFAAAARRQTS
jgi:hypothetical protein